MKDDREEPEAIAAGMLRHLRHARQWSQQRAADEMKAYGYDWRQSTIGKIETGQRPLRLNEAAALARLYGTGLGELLAGVVGSPGAEELDAQITDGEALLKASETRLEHKRELLAQMEESRNRAELAERDEAGEATRYRATLEVLYRLRENLAGQAGE